MFIQRQVAAETLLHWADGEREVYLKGLSNRLVMFYRLFGKMAYRSAWRVTNFLYNEENSFIYGLTKKSPNKYLLGKWISFNIFLIICLQQICFKYSENNLTNKYILKFSSLVVLRICLRNLSASYTPIRNKKKKLRLVIHDFY